jgi:cholesterol transport system auxiliary component
MMTPRHAFLALAATLPLAGCISFGPKPPERLMVLTATSPVEAGPARSAGDAQAIAVAPISAVPAIMPPRIMVSDGTSGVAYIAKERWAAAPPILFRGLLAETITARTGRVVPDPRIQAVTPDTRLSGQLSAFGLDAQGMAVVVTFDGTIARSGREQIDYRRFTARVPVTAQDGPTVGAAINQAANQVAAEVADWVGGAR